MSCQRLTVFGILSQFAVVMLFCIRAVAQQSPANIGFETGTFTGWMGATGHCCPIYTPWQGIDTAQHVITSGTFADPHSNGLVTAVAPGSLFSARLGNDSGHAESERLNFTFTVPQDSMLLVLHFAVILEDAHHPEVKQPRFRYEVSGPGFTPGACLEELIIAGDSTNDFIYIGSYELLNWQTRVFDLTGMTGNTVSIEFETGDCEPGGHFGYAYVDANLAPAGITATLCNPDGSITLYVTPGLGGMWADNSMADSLVIPNPQPDDVYEYYIENDGGCFETFFFSMSGLLPESDFDFNKDCNLNVVFENLSLMQPGAISSWDFGDGNYSQLEDPLHNFNLFGTYEISLTIQNPDYCRSVHHETMIVHEPPVAAFSVDKVCVGTPVSFVNNTTFPIGIQPQYEWFVDEILLSSEPEPVYTFETSGAHELMLIAVSPGCNDTASTNLNVLSEESCSEMIPVWFPNAFTPNGDGINDYFSVITKNVHSCSFTLYNRFGEAVYSGNEWDGNQNGRNCPAGVYTFTVSCDVKAALNSERGTVILIR